jgi:murein L,D-transpeptidase YafK
MFIKLPFFALIVCFCISYGSFSAAKPLPSSARSLAAIEATTPKLEVSLAERGLKLGDPVFLRITKAPELRTGLLSGGNLEIFMKPEGQSYVLYKTLPICAASGLQGPKLATGDGQSPEGFYYLSEQSLNPWSSYHLSLNLGYPNAYDRAHGRTGSYLMIHGNCVSIGCYAMTDIGIDEIYTLVQAAMLNGQNIVRVHSFPFPMTADNMKASENNSNVVFWRNLQEGWDWFEHEKTPPDVTVKGGVYEFQTLN